MNVIELGETVRTRRMRLGMTQMELADKVGVSRKNVWRIEHGEADRVVLGTMVRVFAALDMHLDLKSGSLGPEDEIVEMEEFYPRF